MKTLIIYGSKHGCTEKCSKLLKERLQDEVQIVNIKKDAMPDLASFDKIAIGSAIYVGKAQKEITQFCTEKLNILKNKKIGLFICCMNRENEELQLNTAFPKELLDKATAKNCFGGEFVFKSMNIFERFIVRMISKSSTDVSEISEETIYNFAQAMNKV